MNTNSKGYTEELLQAILRRDFHSFIHKSFNTINPGIKYLANWHIELIAEYLEAVREGDIKRLIINIPPRSLKSVCVSVAWPAWILGHDPSKRIIVSSYSQSISIKHSLDSRLIMSSSWYKQLFTNTALSKKHNQKSKFLTTQNGFRFATSIGGSATGEGGDFLIVDDPHNPVHISSPRMRSKVIEWFEQTFLTRLNDKKNGAVVIVMQRLHTEDLPGYLLVNNRDWELLKIPSQASEDLQFNINSKSYNFAKGSILHLSRDSIETLNTLEKEVGLKNYAAQYLQEPLPLNSSILTLEDISFYDDILEGYDYFVHSWDTAIKISENSDYSVGTFWGVSGNIYHFINMVRAKLIYPDLKNKISNSNKRYKPKFILIEDKASGQQLIQDLKFDGLQNIVAIKPKLDKITRFASSTTSFKSGKALLPRKSSFNSVLLKELTSFPNSKHDDIIDSVSQFLNFMKTITAKPPARIRGF